MILYPSLRLGGEGGEKDGWSEGREECSDDRLLHSTITNNSALRFAHRSFDHFMGLEDKLMKRISDPRKRSEAKQLSRQRVRELLLKKCDITCRLIERSFCSYAYRSVHGDRIREVYDYLLAWAKDAQGFGLPGDVEERLLADKGKTGAKVLGRRKGRKGSAIGAMFGGGGVTVFPNGRDGGEGGGRDVEVRGGGGMEERSVDRVLHSTITNNLPIAGRRFCNICETVEGEGRWSCNERGDCQQSKGRGRDREEGYKEPGEQETGGRGTHGGFRCC